MGLKNYDYYQREWLNFPGHHSTAFVLGEISRGRRWGSLTIGDCGRQVTLSLDMGDVADTENTLHKLDTLDAMVRVLRRKVANRLRYLEKHPEEAEDED